MNDEMPPAAWQPTLVKSLWLKLTAGFLLVALVGVVLVAALAKQVTTSEFQHYMIQGQLTETEELVELLVSHYTAEGSWSGVTNILSGGRGQGSGRGQGGGGQLYLADAQGHIIAGASSAELGRKLDRDVLSEGVSIEVDGQVVGTLVVSNAWTGVLGRIEQEYLAQVNQALIWGGLGAVVVALALGTYLAWRITSPVRKLTHAAERIATGDLSGRVAIQTQDEIGQLATAFNRMADNLVRSDDLRRRMTADIAHELRTPLSIIRGQIEAIQDGIFPPDAEHLAPIHDETLLLNRLVEDLRTLALAEAGQLTLHKTEIAPGPWLERVVSGFKVLAAEKAITLAMSVTPDIPSVYMDVHRIEQVLANLLANAMRHTPKGGVITVQAWFKGGFMVKISDTGPGLAPADLAHVFDRLWRGDKSRVRDRGGAGLGLAIVRQLIEAHGGRAWAESTLGDGAAFIFTLP